MRESERVTEIGRERERRKFVPIRKRKEVVLCGGLSFAFSSVDNLSHDRMVERHGGNGGGRVR